MQFAINAPNFGAFADPLTLVELARAAEDSGWDGFFLWDHLQTGGQLPVGDPWVLLAAIAVATRRIRLGTMVTPVPRRRPAKLARETATLDRLSGGRLILGVGLGDDSWREYSTFGEPVDDRLHGEMLDEGLAVLAGLWSGEPFNFEGKHFQVQDAVFLPTPVQKPRIPVWVAGRWPARIPFRRAARWDGVAPVSRTGAFTPADCRQVVEFVRSYRQDREAFDVAVVRWTPGTDAPRDRDLVESFAQAGATWFQVGLSAEKTKAELLQRIQRGPPRITS